MMRSIQTKILSLILACIVVSCVALGGAGIVLSRRVIQYDSATIMNLMSEEETGALNMSLSRIEQASEVLAAYIQGILREVTDSPEEYFSLVEEAARVEVEKAEDVMAVYIGFSPEFAPGYPGFLWGRASDDGGFHAMTEAEYPFWRQISPEDVEEPGWREDIFYGGAADLWTASYVYPLKIDGRTVGVFGMDLDCFRVDALMKDVGVYDSGYVFLLDSDGTVVYHPEIPSGVVLTSVDVGLYKMLDEMGKGSSGDSLSRFTMNGKSMAYAFRTAGNGMHLAVAAPTREINAGWLRFTLYSIIAFGIIIVIAVTVTVTQTRRLIRPLRELTKSAERIATGDFSVDVQVTTKDEVGVLAASFKKTAEYLRKYIDSLNGQAYRDGLTGVRNRNAYQETAQKMEERIQNETPQFGVIMLDVNYLKETNDNFGHDFGDTLIVESCRIICQTFKHSPVFRFGGDEFVVILERDDYDEREELFRRFDENIQQYNDAAGRKYRISISRGLAIYDPESSETFQDVFKRADALMYENKKEIKGREGGTVR